MRLSRFLLVACASALFAELSTAQSSQITLINRARSTPTTTGTAYATSKGTSLSIDTTNKVFGRGSVGRAASLANSSYLPTGIALDPNSNGTAGCANANNGYTVQFWYRPAAPTTFSYLLGDNTWLGASGAFRVFQNGAAGSGNLYVRGPLGQKTTTGAPLVNNRNTAGWIHLAFVQHNTSATSGTMTWYVNGAINGAVSASTGTGKGKNLTIVGYNGSSSAGISGQLDDIRVYNWARSAADIASDYKSWPVAGNGPSGCLRLPDEGYYWCDVSVNPHTATEWVGKEPGGTFTRLFQTGDTLGWDINSPAKGPFAGNFVGLCIVNVWAGSLGRGKMVRRDAYQQPPALPSPPGPFSSVIVPGLVLASPVSTPLSPFLIWPVTAVYGNNTAFKTGLTMPPLGLVDGDRIDLQWIALDSTYPPAGLGSTNNMTFEYITPVKKYGVVWDVRGINTIQDTGFWEIWNTGTVPIKEAVLDLTAVSPSITWDPAGALNSGGTLAAGTSFRHMTDTICSLTPKTGTRYTIDATNKILTFKFAPPSAMDTGFEGPINHFIFDCDTMPTGTGRRYLGATIKVTFTDNKVLGPAALVADTSDPNGAQVAIDSN